MPCPFASMVELDTETRGRLEALVRAGATPQSLAFRCRIVLRPPRRTIRPTRRSPPNWTVTVIRSASGANASSPAAWRGSRMPLAPVRPRSFSPGEQLAVLSIATSTTRSHDRPVNGWTLDEIAATILNQAHAQAISRATVWRILDRADLKPHRSVSWLNSHDPDFEAKAKAVCRLYLDAPRLLPARSPGAVLR